MESQIRIDDWMQKLVRLLREAFGERLVFVGLQGSYARKEAGPNSDIDAVVILDRVTAEDLRTYANLLDQMPNRELACGFISGRRELECWERSDLFQLCQDTLPIVGDLDFAWARIRPRDVRRAIRIGACNLYHGAVHNLLHGRSMNQVAGLYKAAAFTLRALCFERTGRYPRERQALLEQLTGSERQILLDGIALRAVQDVGEFDALSQRLIDFSAALIRDYEEDAE